MLHVKLKISKHHALYVFEYICNVLSTMLLTEANKVNIHDNGTIPG